MVGLMLQSVYAEHDRKPLPTIVDLGYAGQEARERYAALRAFGIARRNFSFEGHDRLMVKIPPRKREAVFTVFPLITGETYWRSTHHWQGLGKDEETAPIPTTGDQP